MQVAVASVTVALAPGGGVACTLPGESSPVAMMSVQPVLKGIAQLTFLFPEAT